MISFICWPTWLQQTDHRLRTGWSWGSFWTEFSPLCVVGSSPCSPNSAPINSFFRNYNFAKKTTTKNCSPDSRLWRTQRVKYQTVLIYSAGSPVSLTRSSLGFSVFLNKNLSFHEFVISTYKYIYCTKVKVFLFRTCKICFFVRWFTLVFTVVFDQYYPLHEVQAFTHIWSWPSIKLSEIRLPWCHRIMLPDFCSLTDIKTSYHQLGACGPNPAHKTIQSGPRLDFDLNIK